MSALPDEHVASDPRVRPAVAAAPGFGWRRSAGKDDGGSVPAHTWLFLGFVVANLFSGDFGLLGLPAPLDRPLLLLSVVILVLDHRRRRLRLTITHALMALMTLWVLWSWISTSSWTNSYNAFALMDRVVTPMLMFVLAPLMFPDRASRMLLLKTLTLIGIYLGLTGIFETVGPDRLVWPSFITDPSLGIQADRARGPFLASEPMGMAATLITITSGVLVRYCTGWWRVAGVVACVVCPITALLCLTRSVWLSGILSALLCIVVVPAVRRWAPVFAVGGGLAVAGALSLFPQIAGLVTSRADTSRSVYDRLLTDHAALKIIEAKPIFGVGWQRFVDVVPVWVTQADTIPLTNTAISVHNVFLSLAAETGVPGALLWGLVMLSGPVTVVVARVPRTGEMQAWRLIAACGILVWLGPTMLSPNPYPFPNNLVWLVGGVAGSALLTLPPRKTSTSTGGGR